MADRDAFHQEIQSPDWLSDSKKNKWKPSKTQMRDRLISKQGHFFTDNTGESMTTSFISVQNEISWRVLSAKGAVVQVDGGE